MDDNLNNQSDNGDVATSCLNFEGAKTLLELNNMAQQLDGQIEATFYAEGEDELSNYIRDRLHEKFKESPDYRHAEVRTQVNTLVEILRECFNEGKAKSFLSTFPQLQLAFIGLETQSRAFPRIKSGRRVPEEIIVSETQGAEGVVILGKTRESETYLSKVKNGMEINEVMQGLLVSCAKVAIPELSELSTDTDLTNLYNAIDKARPTWKVKDLLTHIELVELLRSELNRLQKKVPSVPYVSNALAKTQRDYLSVPSCLPHISLTNAICNNSLFKSTHETPWPTACVKHNEASFRLEMKPDIPLHLMSGDTESALAKHMWERAAALGDGHADTFDAITAMLLASSKGPNDRLLVDVDELLRMKGLTPKLAGNDRRGGYRPEQRERELGNIYDLSNLWTSYEVPVYTSSKKKPERKFISSRVLSIMDLAGEQIKDENGKARYDVQKFLVQFGGEYGEYLFNEGRQMMLLRIKALNYDPSKQIPEKRLTRYLTWQTRIRAHQGNYQQPYKVRTLFQPSGIIVSGRLFNQAKERFEKALDTLVQDKIINSFEYDLKTWDEVVNGGQRGWFEKWLNALILIEPADAVRDHYYENGLERPVQQVKKLNAKTASTPGERLAQTRKERGHSQAFVAEKLGISRSFLIYVERGERKINQKLSQKIDAYLGQ